MPRMAREKSFDSIYHVMVKSISEVALYQDEKDKIKYLDFVKKAQDQFEFRVYSYCLMDNHAHFIIDANGADISKIMHFVNYKYAMYFNKRHERHGHLFQDRFKSLIVKDDRYLFALSAYVHFNATDIKGYETNPEEYRFSSLSIYLGQKTDEFELVDDEFILSMFSLKEAAARGMYKDFVFKVKSIVDVKKEEFINEGTEYRSMRTVLVRDLSPDKIIEIITKEFDIDKLMLRIKRASGAKEAKAILCFVLRKFCDLKCCDICKIVCMGQSNVSKLCTLGRELIKQEKYKGLLQEILKETA
ncbi:REP element-mobilizing transposase RayT [Caloramator quimbayensis]|uniref:REP element-mobilizing transposase RayT n=1 Tax=Caloramator quimbayensis TaxID=1147123 RepID=A0A1T4YAZ3_9CLOT|nr:transposase [Caloramator quimbayensis]SKA99002.1 REP element-mobilizing transposase RayT [Caloramator quimbayensis]